MTTMEQGIGMKVGSYLMHRAEKKARVRERNARTRNLPLLIVRALVQLAGFSMLTWAGYHLSFVIGCVVAGVSFFLISWLLSSMQTSTPNPDAQQSTMNSPNRR